jgi:methionyl-tRNA formyltransferase
VRWILCGKNTAATECLEHMVARGDEVWVLPVAGDEGRDGWQRSLRRRAEALEVRVTQPRRINAPEVVTELAAWRADGLVSIQYDQILKGPLFRTIGCPCLNLHFALLPRHRGVAPIAWALLEGDTEAGVTLHHMVEDIDAGDVIAQRAVSIDAEDTAREVYEKVSRATVALFRESHPFPPELLRRRLPQDGGRACYHRNGDFDFSRRAIAWGRPAAELQRWIRALIFPPMQYPETTLGGRRWHVTRVGGAVGPPAGAPAGTVVDRADDGFVVAAGEGTLVLRSLVPADGAEGPRVAVGDRFV